MGERGQGSRQVRLRLAPAPHRDAEGPAVDIAIRFVDALDANAADGDDPDLLPVRLVRAAAAVLPADGVGLSIHGGSGRRTPLAASSEVASTAERLQFTVGSGPCLETADSQLPVFASQEVLAHRWPAYHDLLVTQTPLRSVLALALPGRLRGVGGMDTFFTDPAGATTVDVFDARRVAEVVSDHLELSADWSVWTLDELPAWSDTAVARLRGRLWMAVGMLMVALELSAPDALAVLRGYAYAAGRTADDLADDLVEGHLQASQLRASSGSDR
ncbi:ANTAR domain-containing protein [Geodermatophilus sp. SYSU D00691]